MAFFLTTLTESAYLLPPFGWWGWTGLILTYAGVSAILVVRARLVAAEKHAIDFKSFLVLLLLGGLAAFLFVFRLPPDTATAIPGFAGELKPMDLALFIHLPWLVAMVSLGSLEGLVIAFVTGLAGTVAGDRSLYMPAIMVATAALFDLLRPRINQIGRVPETMGLILTAAATAGSMLPLLALFTLFNTSGMILERLDHLTIHVLVNTAVLVALMLSASVIVTLLGHYKVVGILAPIALKKTGSDKMASKFFNRLLPLAVLALVIVIGIVWVVSNKIASRIVNDKVENLLSVSQNQLASFLEAGQQSITQAAAAVEGQDLQRYLPGLLSASQSSTFFKSYTVFDTSFQPVVTLPDQTLRQASYSTVETMAVRSALSGADFQVYAIPSLDSTIGRQFIFVRRISNQNQTLGALIGYTDLRSNSISKPVVDLLDELRLTGATWYILDDTDQLLLSSNADTNLGLTSDQTAMPAGAGTGDGSISYERQVQGVNWKIHISVTPDDTRRIAFTVATPLVLFLAGFLILLLLIWRYTLDSISRSIQSLASEANTISGGNLSSKLVIDREDEVGQLAGSLEVMRLKLKQRLDDLGKVLSVSNSVAENLNFEEAIRPIIQNVLLEGVSFVRVCLDPTKMAGFESDVRHNYVSSKSAEQYAYLDTQLMDLIRNKDYVEIANTARERRLRFKPEATPGALMVLPIHYKAEHYGIMWLGYSAPHEFAVEEIRYLNTMASQASLAASNASLFSSATMGRQRLETVLKSIPDPVLVLDENNQLVMVNDAVVQQDLINAGVNLGVPLHKIVTQPKLVEAMLSSSGKETDREVRLDNGHTFNLMVTPLPGPGKKKGSIHLLKDVTSYKEVDRMRMEFVSAVSHEFKSPLTLLKGYVTMIDMVGQLNDRQKSYLNQMNTDIENLTKLVNNLLDWDRLNSGEELRLSEFSANDLLDDLYRRYQPMMVQNKLDFKLNKLARDETLTADVDLINRALANLLENAIANTPMNGAVMLSARLTAKAIEFVVADNGKGIAPIDLPHTFLRGAQSVEGGPKPHQNLGLSIVKSILERHKGTIRVESLLGQGSTFTAELPTDQKR